MPFGFARTKSGTFFPQLHAHSEFSIKDGCSSLETYADRVVDLGGNAICCTEHGQSGGFARMYFACRDRKIKPIYGMEAYINEARGNLDRVKEGLEVARKRVKEGRLGAAEKVAELDRYVRERLRPSRHAILIAKTRKGYQNLVRVSSDSWINGFYYSPRTDTKFLAEHAEGLIYSTACIGGYIPALARYDFEAGCAEARRLMGIFGPENFRVELMATAYEKQRETNELMLRLAHEVGAKTIVTCDVHYSRPQDQQAQSVLLLMRDKRTIKDASAGEGAWQFDSKDLYWKTLEQVAAVWSQHHKDYWPKEDFESAIRNTYELAASVEHWEHDTSLKLPGVFPNPAALLKDLAQQGLASRRARGHIPTPGKTMRDYAERLVRELGVINGKNFAEYFLVLWDVCKFARESGARLGPGRGSAGGSLTAFVLGITDIDPLRHNLIFERFLDPTRKDAPDVDLDFSPEHREGIKDYIREKYPATATIGTYSTFRTKGALQSVGAVYGIERKDMLQITKPLSDVSPAELDKLTLDQVCETWPVVKEWAAKFPEAWEVVKTLDGLVSHRGQHAAGVLIAPSSALDEIPMIKDPKTGAILTAFPDTSVQGEGSGYEGRELSRLGYVKLDVLGVDTLNSAPMAVELLERETGEKLDLEGIPLDDAKTLEVASTGDVPGAFQFDTNTSRPLMRSVGVDAFGDLAAITALARPGPLKNRLHEQFAALKQSGEAWKEQFPEAIHADLADSRGLMIYQEDVMFTLRGLGGFSMPEANAVRKIMAKKLNPELLVPWRDKFIAGGLERGHPREMLEAIFESLKAYCDYAFPKAHSVAYALTAYRQIFMLAHYPLYYFAGLLATTEKWERLSGHMRSAMARGLSVKPPCVMRSQLEADVESGSIRLGLSKVKGVAGGAEAVLAAREKFNERAPGVRYMLEDFVADVDRRRCNARTVASLIFAGAFDDVTFDSAGLEDLLEDVDEEPITRRNAILVRYAFLTRKSKTKEFERPTTHVPSVLAQKERELIGLLLSFWSSPAPGRLRELGMLNTIAAELERDAARVHILAEVVRCHVHRGHFGEMAFLTLADETGLLENVVFRPTEWKAFKDRLRLGKIAALHLARREARDPRYGRWSYQPDDRSNEPPVSAIAALRRRAASSV